MPEIICNTSPLQYLHQLDQLGLLYAIAKRIIIPPAVVDEIAAGRQMRMDLPDIQTLNWITIRQPTTISALPLVNDLGPGESEVLMLALESRDSVVVLDDALGRRVAESLGLRFTGTLGLLVDAKHKGLISAVMPLLDKLEALRFRLALQTRAAVLRLVGET